jgi:5-(carboxyamino)imidazole ribonucleotide synthase
MIAPGATIGILGGGQLGRMIAGAAARLGYRSHVFTQDSSSPAALVTPFATVAEFQDEAALRRFAGAVDVITFEFENVPAETGGFLARQGKPVHPDPRILAITQDRLSEKDFLRSIGVATTRYAPVTDSASLVRARSEMAEEGSTRAILKTTRLGYDGKGQIAIGPDTDPAEAWRRLGAQAAILESFVDFAGEISVILARNEAGDLAVFPPVENRHVGGILDTTIAPAKLAPGIAGQAEAVARRIAEKLDLVGLLAAEMFLTRGGELLVNELAPRPHNSGHWTIDACHTSQFEQHVRAICGLPLGETAYHSEAIMKNLIGDEVDSWLEHLADPVAKLHLYGKTEARPGRKMGHVTRLLPLPPRG